MEAIRESRLRWFGYDMRKKDKEGVKKWKEHFKGSKNDMVENGAK